MISIPISMLIPLLSSHGCWCNPVIDTAACLHLIFITCTASACSRCPVAYRVSSSTTHRP